MNEHKNGAGTALILSMMRSFPNVNLVMKHHPGEFSELEILWRSIYLESGRSESPYQPNEGDDFDFAGLQRPSLFVRSHGCLA